MLAVAPSVIHELWQQTVPVPEVGAEVRGYQGVKYEVNGSSVYYATRVCQERDLIKGPVKRDRNEGRHTWQVEMSQGYSAGQQEPHTSLFPSTSPSAYTTSTHNSYSILSLPAPCILHFLKLRVCK